MIYTLYEPATGHIVNNLQIDLPEQLEINLNGKLAVEGNYNSDEYYIQAGQPMAKEPKPAVHYQYNYQTHAWEIDEVYLMRMGRITRNNLLTAIDRINPVWYASLTADQQTELINYRTALLNVPQQSGFPVTIEWPTKPAWL
jgi:hypothetical protein